MQLSKRKKIYITAVAVALLGTGTAFAATPKSEPEKPVESQQASLVQSTEEQPATVESSPTVQITTPQQQTQTPVESPPSVTNPYTEGSNIWHAFNVRAEAGLTTPEGVNSDVTYSQSKTLSRVPTQWAIVFTGASNGVAGVVTAINQDGSLTVSCTNCGGGWNTLVEKNVTAENISSLRFLE